MKEKYIFAINMQLENISDSILSASEVYPSGEHDDIHVMQMIEHDRVVSELRKNIYTAIILLKNCKSDEEISNEK